MFIKIKRKVKHLLTDPYHHRLGNALFLWIDPHSISFFGRPYKDKDLSNRAGLKSSKPLYLKIRKPLLLPGDWDLDVIPFKEHETYKFIEELHRYNFNYTKSERFKRIIKNINKGKIEKIESKDTVLDSEKAVHNYMQRYINVSHSMQKNGYLPQKAKDSIRVMVGRNGQLIKEGKGRHRLTIAQMLSIDTIRVKITHIHPLWVQKQQTLQPSLSIIELLRLSLKELELRNQSPP
jgi:hypothetical protein